MVGIVKSSSNDDGIGEIIGLKSELGNMPIFLDPMIQCCSCDNLYWFPTFSLSNHEVWACQSLYLCVCPQIKQISTTSSKIKSQNANGSTNINHLWHLGMDQYLLIPFLGDEHPFTSYFDVHQGYKVLTHCHFISLIFGWWCVFCPKNPQGSRECVSSLLLTSGGLLTQAVSPGWFFEYMRGFIHRGTQNGWFRMVNPIKMNDLGVPLF